MKKITTEKFLAVRIPMDLHTKLKSYAYSQQMTLQELIIDLLKKISTLPQS